ncbi:MAG: hypothetical protein JWM95_4798 [Gemmatimonadetes bacterium]|nr:hypothetical protein [Gemmatimonadota bacterium]
MFVSRFTSSISLVVLTFLGACSPPRASTLPGEIVPVRQLPSARRQTGSRKIVFQWELHDGEIIARGEGAARIASPDSVRLDFFMAGGFGGGAAILIGDSLQVPGPEMMRKLVPPRALLWAALGQFEVPVERDTVVRVDGALLRADIGSPVHWRATFRGDSLLRLDRVEDGRLQEWVERTSDQKVQYRNASARRSLSLVILRTDAVSSFDPAIWRF